MGKIEDVKLKEGYSIFQEQLEYMNGASRIEIWVTDSKGKEVWWRCARTEVERQAAVQAAVKRFGA